MLRAFAPFLALAVLFSNAHAEDSIQVTVTGVLRTGIVAIGGETTGSTITANKVTWELDFGTSAELRAAAEKLNGQQATVSGSLEKKPGVEVKERWIVTVSALKAAAERKPDGDSDAIGLEAREFREGSLVTIAGSAERAVVDVRCERGIDQGVLRRTGDHWPKEIVLQLNLRGLESLKVTSGNVTLEWSVPSSGEGPANALLRSGKRVSTLAPGDPLFTEVRRVKDKDQQFFQVSIPAKLLDSNPTQIRLQWIDFYR